MKSGLIILFIAGMISFDCFAIGTYKASDVVAIKTNGNYYSEIGVATPDGKFIFLKGEGFSCPGIWEKDSSIFIDTASVVGYYWNSSGQKEQIAPFSGRGEFKIYLSDNLETEAENAYTVIFSLNKSRKSKRNIRLKCKESK